MLTELGRAPCLATASIEPGPGNEADADFNDWYHRQHLDMLSMCTGYRRSFRYKLKSSTRPDCPGYIALHEFETVELPADQVARTSETEWSTKVLRAAKKFESMIWKLEMGFGDMNDYI